MKVSLDMFKGIVTRISRDCPKNNLLDQEDLQQELYLKLLEVMPRIEEANEDTVFALAKAILGNKATDLIRFHARRNNINATMVAESREEEVEFSLEDMICDEAFDEDKMVSSFCFPSADTMMESTELMTLITDWASTRSDKIQAYIREAIIPSQETMDKWEAMCEAYPRYRHFTFIPPKTLATMCGLTEKDIYREIEDGLGSFLRMNGYSGCKA